MDRNLLIERLRKSGIGVTLPRIVILDYLMEHRTHPSVDTIFNDLHHSFPKLSRTTVYNTVRILTNNKLAQMITIDNERICIDGDITPHAHLLCRICGKIVDIPLTESSGTEGQSAQFTADGNKIEEEHRYYKGICKSCLRKTL